jgi:hypothetical protein
MPDGALDLADFISDEARSTDRRRAHMPTVDAAAAAMGLPP